MGSGSAAFNLFVIIVGRQGSKYISSAQGVCVMAVPNGEIRQIKDLGPFGGFKRPLSGRSRPFRSHFSSISKYGRGIPAPQPRWHQRMVRGAGGNQSCKLLKEWCLKVNESDKLLFHAVFMLFSALFLCFRSAISWKSRAQRLRF